MPLACLGAVLPDWAFVLVAVGVTLIGIWAASVADSYWGTHDSGRIVIDEVAGYLFTVALIDRNHWGWLLAGFVVFRALDIIKPPPVRWLDRNVGGGSGVVLDDVAAGLMGCALLYALSLTSIPHRIGAVIGG